MKSLIEKIAMDGAAFEKDFLDVILENERLRAALLAAVLGFVVIAILILYIFFNPGYDSLFQDDLGIIILLLSISTLVIYELSFRYLLGRNRIQARTYAQTLSYINSFIEISLPSFLLVFLSSISHSATTLISPVLATYFLIIILSTLRLDFQLSLFTGLLASLEYIVIYMKLFNKASAKISLISGNSPAIFIGWGFMLVGAGLAAGFVAEQIKLRIRQYFRLNQERNEIVNLFGQQISHSIVEVLLKQKPDLRGSKKNVTVMFLDIREFTPFAETNPPEIVVSYLNSLFAIMIEEVNQHHGIINQFLGDGFMATFGAPVSQKNDSANCVQAAQTIIDRVAVAVNAGKILPTRLGIGIHTGQAITGNIGTAIRKQYSITGNVVILASRIEQLNKQYNSQILMSDEVRRAAALKDEMFELIGPVKIKGRSNEVVIYKLA